MAISLIEKRLRAQIERSGPLPVHEFIAQVLYDPLDGYYATKVPIGREGDYITAPEMTQAFGEVIALWLIDLWEQAGRPAPFYLIEMGPGRGTLMADMLRTFQKLKIPFPQMAVHLVEISPLLKKLQQQALVSFPVSCHWHESIETLPNGFGFIVGNEFWDALPVSHISGQDSPAQERQVGLKGSQLVFLPEQGVFQETCPALFSLAHQISQHLKDNGGAALFLDYGYDDPAGRSDTLQALFQHQRCSPLEHIGRADLTHHVDFHTLKRLFGELPVYGPVPQGDFLKAIGLDIRTEALCKHATPNQQSALRTAAVRLAHPAHMGALFKVLAVVSDSTLKPAGFGL